MSIFFFTNLTFFRRNKKKELKIIELIHEFKCQGRTLGLFLLHIIMNGSWDIILTRSSICLSLGRRGVKISLVIVFRKVTLLRSILLMSIGLTIVRERRRWIRVWNGVRRCTATMNVT